jgi:hypothetical protein
MGFAKNMCAMIKYFVVALAFITAGTLSVQAQPLDWRSMQSRGEHGIHTAVTLSDGSIVAASGTPSDYEPFCIYRSFDAGRTWSFLSASVNYSSRILPLADGAVMMQDYRVASIAVPGFEDVAPVNAEQMIDRTIHYVTHRQKLYAISDSVILSTSDKGVNWGQFFLKDSGIVRGVTSGADGNLYIISTTAIWRLRGSGNEWERFELNQPSLSRVHLAVTRSGAVMIGEYSRLRMARIENGTVVMLRSKEERIAGLAVSPSGRLYRFSENLSRSTDEGATWEIISPVYGLDRDQFGYTFDSTGYLLLFTKDESYRIGDTRPTFELISIPNSATSLVRISNGAVMAVPSFAMNATEITTDRGLSWRHMLPVYTRRVYYRHLDIHPAFGTWLLLNYHDIGQGQEVNWYYILHSVDGVNWTQTEKLPSNGNVTYIGTDGYRLFFQDDAKGVIFIDPDVTSFETASNAFASAQVDGDPGVRREDELIVPVGSLLYCLDLRAPERVRIDSTGGKYFHSAVADYDENHLLFYNSIPHAWDGEKYVAMTPLPVGYTPINDVLFAGDRWYVATDSGLFYSEWKHASGEEMYWQRCDETLADKNVLSIAYNLTNELLVGTRFSGVYIANLDLVSVEHAEALDAAAFYPNPANTTVTVVNVPEKVTIEITDQLGRVLYRDLADTRQATISVAALAAGAYILRIGDTAQPLIISR